MKGGLLLLLPIVTACGDSGAMTNDVLAGSWFDTRVDAPVTMDLVAGPDGVRGKFKDVNEAWLCSQGIDVDRSCVRCCATVTTLPDLGLRWTFRDGTAEDYRVEILPVCPGEPRPTGWPDPLRIHIVRLADVTNRHLYEFTRNAPKPICSIIQPG